MLEELVTQGLRKCVAVVSMGVAHLFANKDDPLTGSCFCHPRAYEDPHPWQVVAGEGRLVTKDWQDSVSENRHFSPLGD